MKNISTLLSSLCLVLIGVLFYLHFSQKSIVKTSSPAKGQTQAAEFRIAYFDIDSLQLHFEYFKKVSNEMKARENAMTIELRTLENSYQKKIKQWQDRGTNMTQEEGEAAQREYAQMQQRYQKRQMDLEQELQKQKVDLMTDLRKKVEDYLKEYNKEKGYAFILSYEPGFMLYYKDPLFDITGDLISGLNEKYKSKLKD